MANVPPLSKKRGRQVGESSRGLPPIGTHCSLRNALFSTLDHEKAPCASIASWSTLGAAGNHEPFANRANITHVNILSKAATATELVLLMLFSRINPRLKLFFFPPTDIETSVL